MTVNGAKSVFNINKPGAYFVSYNLILKTTAKTLFTGGVVLDQKIPSGLALLCIQESHQGTVQVTGAGILRLTTFNSISIAIKFNETNHKNSSTSIQAGSTFTAALITTAGAVPAFSFKLQRNVLIAEKSTKELSDWSTGMQGAFHVTVGFLPTRNYVQAICDGIYLLSLNLVVKAASHGTSMLKLMINQQTLREVEITFESAATKNLNIHQIMHLFKADIVKITLAAVKNNIEVLEESTYSMTLVNKISQHTTGFSTRLRNNISISNVNKLETISGWPAIYNQISEFKSPTFFSQIVNNRDFNAAQRGVYLIATNLKLQWQSVPDTELTVSIYSKPSGFHLIKKTIRHTGNSNMTHVSLAMTAELQTTDPVSVTIEIQYGHVYILPGSTFSAVQLPIYYPGMLARLPKSNSFSNTGWKTITNWKTNEIKGGYDFFDGTNSTSGTYRVSYDGLYSIAANIIVEDLEEVEVLVTKSKDFKVENGIFTKVGNPTSTMTLNLGGIMELKKGDEICAVVHSPSDSDWSIKGNTGFSVAYIGQNSHAFRAYLPTTKHIQKSGWTNISNWQTMLHFGGSFTSASGQFIIPVSGVYHASAIAILGNADSTQSGSQYGLAIFINGVQATGLYSHVSGPDSDPQLRRYYPLFMSGAFKAKKGDVVTYAVYSSKDFDFHIFEFSSWSLFLVAQDNDIAQVGFSTSKNVVQSFTSTESNSWYEIGHWRASTTGIGSFYTPSSINFDNGITATVQMTGFYLISSNIYVQRETSPSVMKLALFIQGELQENGITYENIRKWNSFSLHFSGVAFLMEGQTVKLVISSTTDFSGLIIFKESGFSMVRLPIAELFPGASLISMVGNLQIFFYFDFFSILISSHL